jgi:hypothetical protein
MTTHAFPIRADGLSGLLGGIQSQLTSAFATIEWAEDEIAQAVERHPRAADSLYHAFALLHPREIGPGMHTELVYRAHARELLDRIGADTDTRPATAAEICLACSEISLRGPMHSAAAGLYFRMWLLAFPDHPVTRDQADEQIHYERLYGTRIDELEAVMRRRLADPERQLADVECPGRHHGQPTTCRYAKQSNPG